MNIIYKFINQTKFRKTELLSLAFGNSSLSLSFFSSLSSFHIAFIDFDSIKIQIFHEFLKLISMNDRNCTFEASDRKIMLVSTHH